MHENLPKNIKSKDEAILFRSFPKDDEKGDKHQSTAEWLLDTDAQPPTPNPSPRGCHLVSFPPRSFAMPLRYKFEAVVGFERDKEEVLKVCKRNRKRLGNLNGLMICEGERGEEEKERRYKKKNSRKHI